MNILVGKLGRAVFFDPKNRGIVGGDEALPLLTIHLAKTYPQHDFYVMSRNDISKMKKPKKTKLKSFFIDEAETEDTASYTELPSNIFDMWGLADERSPAPYNDYKVDAISSTRGKCIANDYVYRFNDTIKYDFALVFNGPQPSSCLYGTLKTDGSGEPTSPPDYSNTYVAPLVYILNETNVPWFMIDEDPRYIKNQIVRDLINIPRMSLSQTNMSYKNTSLKNYPTSKQEKVYYDLKHKYSRPETIFLLDETKYDFRNDVRTNDFIMTLNGPVSTDHLTKTPRMKYLTEWVWPLYPDVKAFGKWNEKWTKEYPDKFENKPISTITDDMYNSKYTLIVPISDNDYTANFITQKFWKTIAYGIIPFLTPNYDVDKLFKVPSILRPRNPKEFKYAIDYLNANEDEYRKLLGKLYDMLDDSLFDGTQITDTINTNMIEQLEFNLEQET